MKRRSDFVTNSSSSSFIVAFDSKDSIAVQLSQEKILHPCRHERLLKDILEGEIKDVEAYLAEYREDIYYHVKWQIEDQVERSVGWQNARKHIEENTELFDRMVENALNKEVDGLRDKLSDKNFVSIIEVSDHDDSELEHDIMPHLKCTIERISHH